MPPPQLEALKAKPTGKWDPGRQISVGPSALLRHVQGTSGMRGLPRPHEELCQQQEVIAQHPK